MANKIKILMATDNLNRNSVPVMVRSEIITVGDLHKATNLPSEKLTELLKGSSVKGSFYTYQVVTMDEGKIAVH